MLLSIFGEQHLDVATSYNVIGLVYDSQGNYTKALEYHEKSLAIRLSIFGENHPDVADSYENLYDIYTKLGDTEKAEECRLKAEEVEAALEQQ